ncbi:MAG: DeoR family transcriptional regulator [Bacteroidaceae bacterium]|nr:DeoR family transcriptional regulator [Bacteroidaceae bacterium]
MKKAAIQVTIERTKFEQMVNVGGVTKEVTSNVTSLSPVQLTDRQKEISKMMLNNPRISVKEMSLVLSLAERTIRRDLSVLQTKGFIRHDEPDKGGRWVVIKG